MNIEKLTWGPNDDRRRLAPFRVRHDPFVSFSGVVAAMGVVVMGGGRGRRQERVRSVVETWTRTSSWSGDNHMVVKPMSTCTSTHIAKIDTQIHECLTGFASSDHSILASIPTTPPADTCELPRLVLCLSLHTFPQCQHSHHW
jgi:hypothetical protein